MKTETHRLAPLLCVVMGAVAAFLPRTAHAAPPYVDDFNPPPATWTSEIISPSSIGADSQSGPIPTGGFTGGYRKTTNILKPGTSTTPYAVVAAHERGFAWTPSSDGSIVLLDYSYRLRHLITLDGSSTSAAAGFAVLAKQGNVYYRTQWDNAYVDLWLSFGKTGLSAKDFTRVDGTPGNPDFTCTGTPISFGYVTGNSNPNDKSYTIIGGIDDLSINFTSKPCATCLTFTQTKAACESGPSGPSGCYRVTTTVTNNTGQPLTALLLSSGQASPNVIPLSPVLEKGQTRTVAFTYCTSSTGSSATVSISPLGGSACCQSNLVFDLPKCPLPECLWIPRYTTRCVPGAPVGTFDLTLDYRNITSCSTRVFIVAGPPSAVVPSYFPGFSPNPNGPSNSLGVIHVTGANSSSYCFTVAQACTDGAACCSRVVCVPVPNCWSSPMPAPTPIPPPLEAIAGSDR